MNNLKQFIRDYNFTNPSWDNLPIGFPNVSEADLNKEEVHLLEAIKMAWLVADEEKTNTIYKYVLLNRMAGLRIINTSFTILFVSGFSLILISVTYYLNIKYDLGFQFLTEYFA